MAARKYPGYALKKGCTGAAVTVLQQQLKANGFSPGPIDGEFGPKTLAAVKDYQARHSDTSGRPLVVDGIVGLLTWRSLFGVASVPAAPPATSLGAAILAEAKRLLAVGTKEVPPGSNWGDGVKPIIEWAGGGKPAQWCQYFAWWCSFVGAKASGLTQTEVQTEARWRMPSGQTWTTSRWAIKKGWFYTVADVLDARVTPMPGDMCFVHLSSAGGHVGLVKSYNGKVHLIEGNASNRVKERVHNLSDIKQANGGFCRLR